MRDDEYDPHLALCFAEAPAFGDEEAFAAALDRRVGAQDRRRRIALSLAGAGGAAIAAASLPPLADLLSGPALSPVLSAVAQQASWAWLAAGAVVAIAAVAYALQEA